MEASANLAAIPLRDNLKTIRAERDICNERLKELNEDERALLRVMKRLGIEPSQQQMEQQVLLAPKPADPTRGKKRDIVIDVLREKGIPMKSIDIRDSIQREKGIEINQNTFDSIMSKLQSEFPQSKVKKVAYRTYQYAA